MLRGWVHFLWDFMFRSYNDFFELWQMTPHIMRLYFRCFHLTTGGRMKITFAMECFLFLTIMLQYGHSPQKDVQEGCFGSVHAMSWGWHDIVCTEDQLLNASQQYIFLWAVNMASS